MKQITCNTKEELEAALLEMARICKEKGLTGHSDLDGVDLDIEEWGGLTSRFVKHEMDRDLETMMGV